MLPVPAPQAGMQARSMHAALELMPALLVFHSKRNGKLLASLHACMQAGKGGACKQAAHAPELARPRVHDALVVQRGHLRRVRGVRRSVKGPSRSEKGRLYWSFTQRPTQTRMLLAAAALPWS